MALFSRVTKKQQNPKSGFCCKWKESEKKNYFFFFFEAFLATFFFAAFLATFFFAAFFFFAMSGWFSNQCAGAAAHTNCFVFLLMGVKWRATHNIFFKCTVYPSSIPM